MKYDLIIIGSGSVGSAAGYYATQAGLNVLMIDAHHPLILKEAITAIPVLSVTLTAKVSAMYRWCFGLRRCGTNWRHAPRSAF